MGRGRAVLALGVAAAVHVAVAALLPQSAPESARDVGDLPVHAETSIDLESEAPPQAPTAAASSARDEATSRRTDPLAKVSEPLGLALAMRQGEAGDDDRLDHEARRDETSPSSRAGGATWTFPTTRPNLALGEHTGALARASGIGLPSEGKRLDGPLLLSADGIDAANGRARSGPLREAVDEVARRAEAPTEGVAVFEITVGPEHPAKARLLEASSNYGGWSGLTEAIDAATSKKVLRLPPDGRALRVVLRVEAAMKLVDGRRAKDLGVKTSTTGLGVRENASSGEPSVVLPTASLHLRGKVCSLTLTGGFTTSPISGGCSLETIGTPAVRRVTTTLVSEERVSIAAP